MLNVERSMKAIFHVASFVYYYYFYRTQVQHRTRIIIRVLVLSVLNIGIIVSISFESNIYIALLVPSTCTTVAQ